MQVGSNPLKLSVEHLKDLPYQAIGDEARATSMQLLASLKELLQQHPLYQQQLHVSFQLSSDLHDLSRMTDIAAYVTSAAPNELQQVLAELNVLDRSVLSDRVLFFRRVLPLTLEDSWL